VIVLNLDPDQPLVRVESAQDIISLPGFEPRIDPKTDGHRLHAVIGAYHLDEEVHCGLPCNQPHRRGYVVRTDKGAVIMLGKDCGNRHFGVDFRVMQSQYVRLVADKTRRETIERGIAQLPLLRERVQAIRDAGATRLFQLCSAIHRETPPSVATALRDMLSTGRTVLVVQRAPTAEERDLYQAQHGAAPGPGYTVGVEVGRIEGLAALTPELDLRRLLTNGIEETMRQLERANLDAISTPARNRLAKAVNQIEDQFSRIDAAMAELRRLFTRQNLEPFVHAAHTPQDRRQFRSFLDTLPG
jgi:hypothetical protein